MLFIRSSFGDGSEKTHEACMLFRSVVSEASSEEGLLACYAMPTSITRRRVGCGSGAFVRFHAKISAQHVSMYE